MKNIIYKPIAILAVSVLLNSCNKFLDEVPDARTEIDSAEKVQELLGSAYPLAFYMNFSETMSDNAGDKTNLSESSVLNTDMYSWNTNNETGSDTPTYYWLATYEAIASANHALEAIETLPGGTSKYNYLKGEALVARAYAHFMLSVFWCKPYNPTTATTDVGLPYVTKAEKKVFENYQRISLQAYYNAIEKDLNEGIPLIDNSKYSKPKFHFTKEAAHAFASRFYLMKGDWDKVIQHANEALGSNPEAKLRNIKGQSALTYAQKKVQYTSSDEVANVLIASGYSAYDENMAYNKYGMTVAISGGLFQASLHPFGATGASWSYAFYGGDDYRNFPKFNYYFRYINISSGLGYRYNMGVLLSYDEVMLNRMEAYVMKGEKAKFLEDLQVYLPLKTSQNLPTSLFTEANIDAVYSGKGTDFDPAYTLSTTQREWLQCVVDLRRVEFVFEGLRWFDIKRLGLKVTHVKAGTTMELPKTDLRRELQIPADAIANGISANPR